MSKDEYERMIERVALQLFMFVDDKNGNSRDFRGQAASALAIAYPMIKAAEWDRLREALKPFSKPPIGVIIEDSYMFDACSDNEIIYETHGWPADKHAIVTVGDIRRARAALDTPPQSGGENE